MSVRKINRTSSSNTRFDQFNLPKASPGVIYVRQSGDVQVRENIHSYEMQTKLFEKHFREQGFTGVIIIIADDEGMSGTLDIHKRPGLTRVMRLIEGEELIGGKRVGWVAAVAVNRFSRDPWLITPGVLMKTCHQHDIWVLTLRMYFNFKDTYCQRVFMIEAEEAARHLDWMKTILGGAKKAASAKGYYDGRVLSPGYIVDRTDPHRKKLTPYEPHIAPTQWLFNRIVELDFNVRALCREVNELPYLYPKMDSSLDPKTLRRFRMNTVKEGSFAGHHKPSRQGILSILTNPVYIGWWIPIEGEIVKDNHPAIIDEELFWLVFDRISLYDLEGNRVKPDTVTRNGGAMGVLKKVLIDETGKHFYASVEKGGRYCIMERNSLVTTGFKTLTIRLIDSVFLERFFERLRNWTGFEDWSEQIKHKEKALKSKRGDICKLISEAQREWDETMGTLTNPKVEKTEQMKSFLAKKCKGLEERIAELEKDLSAPDEDGVDEIYQYKIATLLPDLIEEWDELPFEKRLTTISAFVKSVILEEVSSSWLKMTIQWKRTDWEIEERHVLRENTAKQFWTPEEDAILREFYPESDTVELLHKLPTRNYNMIVARSSFLGLRRLVKDKGRLQVHRLGMGKDTSGVVAKYERFSIVDWEYMDAHSLTMGNYATWSSQGCRAFVARRLPPSRSW